MGIRVDKLIVTLLFICVSAQLQAGDSLECTIFSSSFEVLESKGVSAPDTSFSGRLLDTNDYVSGMETPIANATISFLGTGISTVSGADGSFFLAGLPGDSLILDIDSSTALPGPNGVSYAGFREKLNVIGCLSNVEERPFFLPRIDESSIVEVDPSQTTTVTNSSLGVSMTVPPHTAMQDGSEFEGALSISEVPGGLAPAALPAELDPGLLVTIQPVGVTFADPVPMTFPNIDQLASGSMVNLWSLDPDSGEFEIVGRGEVNEDGSEIETISGGVRAADWHFILPFGPIIRDLEPLLGIAAPFLTQTVDGSSEISVRDGSVSVGHELPEVVSLNKRASLRLTYHSQFASPLPVVRAVIQLPRQGFAGLQPVAVSNSLAVNLIPRGSAIYTDGDDFSPLANEVVVQAAQFDASDLYTGSFLYRMTIKTDFEFSSVGTTATGLLAVNNLRRSVFGAGWAIDEVDRLHVNANTVLLVEGGGAVTQFQRGPAFTIGSFSDTETGIVADAFVTGDINVDGYPDIIDLSFRSGGGGVIHLNDGAGGFDISGTLGLGTNEGHRAALGRIDEDEFVDIVISRGSFAGSSVRTFFGDGKGGFSSGEIIDVGSLPNDIALADVDNDTNLDIVTANQFDGTITLLLNDGTGTFPTRQDFNARALGDRGPAALATSDFDEDGNADVAVANDGSGEVAVLFGTGDGEFSSPLSLNVAAVVKSILVADFDDDGHSDIAVTAFNGNQNAVAVFLGNGLGNFSSPVFSPVGLQPQAMDAGDLNRDGLIDLAVANTKSNTVSILMGQGTGFLQTVKTLDFRDLPINRNELVAIEDFNLDQFPDIAVLADEQFLDVNNSNTLTIVENATIESNQLQAPAHVFSRMFENEDGTFRHELKDGTRVDFDLTGRQTARTDRYGNETGYAYDNLGRLRRVTFPTNQNFDVNYSAGCVTITDPTQRVTELILGSDNQLLSITSPDGGITGYEYGDFNRLTRLTTPGSYIYNYEYDASGMVTRVSLPNGEVREFDPGLRGSLPQTAGEGTPTNPLPAVEADRVVDRYTDGLGRVTQYTTNHLGAATEIKNPLNQTVVLERDERSLVTRIRLKNLKSIHFGYDERGNLTSYEDPSGEITQFTYNQFDLPDSAKDAQENTVVLSYNANGGLIGYNDTVGTIANTYNAMGLLQTQTDHLNNTTAYEYDSNGNLTLVTDGDGHETVLTRGPTGHVIGATDNAGVSVAFNYDVMNRVVSTSDELELVNTYAYDSQGNISEVSGPAGLVASYDYNAVRQVTSRTDALDRTTLYEYDVARNLISVTAADGNKVSFAYDELNRPVSAAADDGELATYSYNALGKMTRIADNDSLIEAEYDDLGRVTQLSFDGSGVHAAQPDNAQLTLAYGPTGLLQQLTQPDGSVISYEYDARDILSRIIADDVTHDFVVDPTGRPLSITSQLAGGITSSAVNSYTPTDQLESLTLTIDGSQFQDYQLTLDAIGNRTTVADSAGSHIYVYDNASRLIQATHPDQPSEDYSYDDLGNRLTSSFTVGEASYDVANQLESNGQFSYQYDARGNLAVKTDTASGEYTEYTYNGFDQLVRIQRFSAGNLPLTSATYAYDGLGRRIMKTVDGQVSKYVHYGANAMAEYDQNDQLQFTYLHGPTPNMILSSSSATDTYIYHRDPLGSVVAMTDSLGNVVNEYTYDSFGRRIAVTESVPNSYSFSGAEFDEESDLYFMRARYYDPFAGRFVSPDPRDFTQGLNLYHYVKNNPINFSDPTGEAIWGAVAGATSNLLGQALDGRSSAKNTKPLEFNSFAFDTAMGAANCSAKGAASGLGITGKAKTLFDVAIDMTGAAVSSEFKPDITGGKPPTDGEFWRDVLLAAGVGQVTGKLADPFKSNELINEGVDKGSGIVLDLAGKPAYTSLILDDDD